MASRESVAGRSPMALAMSSCRGIRTPKARTTSSGRKVPSPTAPSALDTEISAQMVVRGMTEGWFTGKKVSSYLPSKGLATLPQPTSARLIINGLDHAKKVAKSAMSSLAALIAGRWACFHKAAVGRARAAYDRIGPAAKILSHSCQRKGRWGPASDVAGETPSTCSALRS
jgi:hypothetical protein